MTKVLIIFDILKKLNYLFELMYIQITDSEMNSMWRITYVVPLSVALTKVTDNSG